MSQELLESRWGETKEAASARRAGHASTFFQARLSPRSSRRAGSWMRTGHSPIANPIAKMKTGRPLGRPVPKSSACAAESVALAQA